MRRSLILLAVLALIPVAAQADPILIKGNFELGPQMGGLHDVLIWGHIRFSFVATGSASTLSFASLSDSISSYGALIDHVRVHRTPDRGSSLLLLGIGLVALLVGLRAWRKRRKS